MQGIKDNKNIHPLKKEGGGSLSIALLFKENGSQLKKKNGVNQKERKKTEFQKSSLQVGKISLLRRGLREEKNIPGWFLKYVMAYRWRREDVGESLPFVDPGV